jgi:SAM-dependent methyltransferase
MPPPLPPVEYRNLVGCADEAYFDNPSGAAVFPQLPPSAYASVLDFGCGCGRLARQLIQQRTPPRRYVGVDIHAGMVAWCRDALAPLAPGFEFHHHDLFNRSLNPGGAASQMAFPVADGSVTLLIAWSVFTHLNEAQATFYLAEAARVLAPDGVLVSTWFLFDKTDFPMMQHFQNALFINDVDLLNAVIFDKAWLRRTCAENGLAFSRIEPPGVRGYQWQIWISRARPGQAELEYPPDVAPAGRIPPPIPAADGNERSEPPPGDTTS